MKRNAWFWLVGLVICLCYGRIALAHLDAAHKSGELSPTLTIADFGRFLKSRQVALRVPDSLRAAPLYGKFAAHTLKASIRRALVGYNYIIESGPDGRPRKVVVTGTNDDGADNPVLSAQSRPLGYQPVSPKRFTSYLKAVPNPKAVRSFNLTADRVKQLEPDDRITLQLPEGEVTADVTRRGLGGLGGEVVIANVAGGGRLQAVYGRDGSIYGRIYTDYGSYRIVEDKQGHPVVFDLSEAGVRPEWKHEHQTLALRRKQQGRSVAAAQYKKPPAAVASPESFLARWKREATVVDLLVYRDRGLTDAMVDYEVLAANQAFIDSQVLIRVRAVHVAPYNSEGIADPLSEYDRATRDPNYHGVFDGAVQLRDQVGGDIVAVLVNNFSQEMPLGAKTGAAVYSLGRMNGELMQFPEFAIMFSSVGPLSLENTFVHELGHVFGLEHAREDGGTSPEDQWIFPYASGYYNGIVGTIMSYSADIENHPMVFSNPNLDCFGAPCGRPNYADAAAALNQVRDIVANFYPTRVLLTPADGSYRESAVVRHNLLGGDSRIYQEATAILGGDPLTEGGSQLQSLYDGPANCVDILQKGQSVGDGWYRIQLGDGSWQDVFCVMTIPGYEGFMLVGRSVPWDPLPPVGEDYFSIYGDYDESTPFRTDAGSWSFSILGLLRMDGMRQEGGLFMPNNNEVFIYDMKTISASDQASTKEAEALGLGYSVTRWMR